MNILVSIYRENRSRFWQAVFLGLLGFLILLSYSFLRSVADSLFIHYVGSNKLHLGWIYTGFAITISVLIYNRLSHLLHTVHLFTISVFLSLVIGVGLWFLIERGFHFAIIPFYIFKEIYVIFLVEQIWTLCALLFIEKSAKCFYGLFMTVATLGAVLGNIVSASVVQKIGTLSVALLGLSSLGLILLFLVPFLLKPEHFPISKESRHRDLAQTKSSFGIIKLFQTGYLKYIFFIILIIQIITPFIELQFSSVIEREIAGLDDKTQFMEWVWGIINSVALVCQLFVSAPILVTFGVGSVLWFVPGGTLVLLGLFMALPKLWAMAILRIFNRAMDYSLYRAAKEILYLPFDYEAKNKAKALIDMWMYRFGKTIAGFLKGGLGFLFLLTESRINMLIILLLALWLILTYPLLKAYGKEVAK